MSIHTGINSAASPDVEFAALLPKADIVFGARPAALVEAHRCGRPAVLPASSLTAVEADGAVVVGRALPEHVLTVGRRGDTVALIPHLHLGRYGCCTWQKTGEKRQHGSRLYTSLRWPTISRPLLKRRQVNSLSGRASALNGLGSAEQ